MGEALASRVQTELLPVLEAIIALGDAAAAAPEWTPDEMAAALAAACHPQHNPANPDYDPRAFAASWDAEDEDRDEEHDDSLARATRKMTVDSARRPGSPPSSMEWRCGRVPWLFPISVPLMPKWGRLFAAVPGNEPSITILLAT